MTAALILFVFFVMIYIVIADIITIFFRLTGLTEENARFQVVSLLTNSGFTTRESESIVSSKVRRKLARATMIFGYVFTVTIVATMVNFFTTLEVGKMHSLIRILPFLLLIVISFHLLRKSTSIKSRFDKRIERIGSRLMYGNNSNPVVLMEDYDSMVVAQVYLRRLPSILQDIPLSESIIMSEYNIMVLMVKNHYGEAKQANADTILKKNDIIIVLGDKSDIREVFGKV